MELVYHPRFRQQVLAGIDAVADTVKVTMGPKGRNVAMYQKENIRGAEYSDRAKSGAKVLITNDGVTIARGIRLGNSVENMGAQLLLEAAMKANDAAGDGTTTAIVLTQSVLKESFRGVAAGMDPLALRRGIQKAVSVATDALTDQARPIRTAEEIARVAAISCQDGAIGAMIGEALEKVGLEGVLTVEDSPTWETTAEILEGIVFERGLAEPFMATDPEKPVAELHDPCILLYDGHIDDAQALLTPLIAAAEAERDMLIISDGVEGEALGLIRQNKGQGDMNIVCVLAPLYGEGRRWRMEDMAVQTGGTYISKELGTTLDDVTLDMLGSAEYVKVTHDRTLIMGGAGDPDAIAARIQELRYYAENTDYSFNAQRHRERLAKFVSGVAKINVGGRTETELWERKLRVEDAVNAARAAYAEGVVPGGGTALLNTIPSLKKLAATLEGDERFGVECVIRAVQRPLGQIAENAGLESSVVAAKVLAKGIGCGYDVDTDTIVDMFAAGVVDPLKVTRMALGCAMSVAGTLLSAEAGVAYPEVAETKPE